MTDTERFLELLWQPGDVREVRIPDTGYGSRAGYFDDPARAAAAVAEWDGRANVYVTLNPVRPDLLARAVNRLDKLKSTTADVDITGRRWLLVDVDPKRPAGVSATDAESAAALDVARAVWRYLDAESWPKPLVALTGNGYALLYPTDLPNEPDTTAIVAGWLRGLAARFDTEAVSIDTTVSNAARIGCLVGTLKVKGDSTAERPHRRSAIVREPAEPVPVSRERLAALAGPTNGREPSRGDGTFSGWVQEWLDVAGVEYRELPADANGIVWYGLRPCPFCGEARDCGVGEGADGTGTGKCFHNRGAGKGWAEFRDALGLGAGVTLNMPGRGADILSADAGVPSGTKQTIAFLTARELAAETSPETPWRVAGLLADGALTELDGRPKTAGKSTFGGHLIGAVLDGRPFLGRRTVRSPVVLLSEQPAASLRSTLAAAGVLDRDDLHLLLLRAARGADWPAIVTAAVAECQRTAARVLAIDTLPQWAGLRGDAENDSGSALEALRPLQDAAADGLAVLLMRHDRKSGGDVGESARGSSAFTGAVDIVLRLSRRPDALRPTIRELAVLSRFEGWPEQEMIELTAEGYVSLGNEQAFALVAARAALLDGLPTDEPGLTLDEIVPALIERRTTAQAAIVELIGEGRVTRAGKGRKGDPYRYLLADPPIVPDSLSAAPMVAANRKRKPAESTGANGPDLTAEAERIFGDMLTPPADPTDLSAMVPRGDA